MRRSERRLAILGPSRALVRSRGRSPRPVRERADRREVDLAQDLVANPSASVQIDAVQLLRAKSSASVMHGTCVSTTCRSRSGCSTACFSSRTASVPPGHFLLVLARRSLLGAGDVTLWFDHAKAKRTALGFARRLATRQLDQTQFSRDLRASIRFSVWEISRKAFAMPPSAPQTAQTNRRPTNTRMSTLRPLRCQRLSVPP
jgi:hypothetical protein